MPGRSSLPPIVALATLVWAAPALGDGASAPASTGSPPAAPPAPAASPAPAPAKPEKLHPPPLHVEFAQYGVALTATIVASPGSTCGAEVKPPCILGSGGGLVIRGGYRTPGPWYIGGAYEFTKMDSGNLYRLGIFQQIRAELRYLPDFGSRAAPYVTWGVGGLLYGNEWGVETAGALIFAGGGVEVEVSRVALIGLGLAYRPALIAGWRDTAGIERPTGIAQFVGIELQLEIRTELGRR